MSIAATDLKLYCTANMPEDDTSTSGGALDTTIRPVFTQLTSNAQIALVSDGADTRNVTITGRSATGAVVQEVKALNGTNEVVTTATFERILKVIAASADGSRTVTVKQGAGGSTITTIPPNEVGFRITFYYSASEASPTARHEKVGWKNTHGSLDALQAFCQLSADPSAKITKAICVAKDDSTSIANRKATPAGVTFVDDGVDQAVPGGNLEFGSYICEWIKQSLGAGDAAAKSTYTLQFACKST